MLKVSLLMTTYNCKDHFKQSIRSALSQDYPNLEIVICDSASTDGTLEEILDISEAVRIDKDGRYFGKTICWISEKDQGIYDGLNKGLDLSTGDIIAVFNDLFASRSAISQYVKAIVDNKADGAHSDLIYMDGERCVRYWRSGQGSIRFGWMPAHPTLYLRRSVYEKYGKYNLKYKSSSDYDFILRIFKGGNLKLAYIPRVLIRMYYGGTSSAGLKGYWRNIREAYQALYNNQIAFPIAVIFLRIVRTSKQFWDARGYNRNGKRKRNDKSLAMKDGDTNQKINIATALISTIMIVISVIFRKSLFFSILLNIACSILAASIMSIFLDTNTQKKYKKRINAERYIYFSDLNRQLQNYLNHVFWLDERMNDKDFNWDLPQKEYFTLPYMIAMEGKYRCKKITYDQAKARVEEIHEKYSYDAQNKMPLELRNKTNKLFLIMAVSSADLGKETEGLYDKKLELDYLGLMPLEIVKKFRNNVGDAFGLMIKENFNHGLAVQKIWECYNILKEYGSFEDDFEITANGLVNPYKDN